MLVIPAGASCSEIIIQLKVRVNSKRARCFCSYISCDNVSWRKLSTNDISAITSNEDRTRLTIQHNVAGISEAQSYEEVVACSHLLTGRIVTTLSRADPQRESPLTHSQLQCSKEHTLHSNVQYVSLQLSL